MKIKLKLTYIILVLFLIIFFIVIFFKQSGFEEIDITKYFDEKDIIVGNISSGKFLIEYSSFDCPACRYFHINLFENIESAIKNNEIAYVLRLIPERNSEISFLLVKAGYCSIKVTNSIEFIKKIFREYENIKNVEDIYALFEGNVTKLKDCINSKEAEIYLRNCYKRAIEDKIIGTPTFILIKNGKVEKIVGAQLINLN